MDEKIIEIMKRVFAVSDLDTTASQTTCEKWDSLNHLNLMEDAFDMEFEPEEIAAMTSFDAVKRTIESKS